MSTTFRQDIIKIVIDKLLIGMIIAAVVLLGNAWLEKYKNILSKERIFYERKYDLINKMQISYKELTSEIFNKINNKDTKYDIKYLDQFERQVTQVTPYLSESLSKELEKMLWLLSPDFEKMGDAQKYADYLGFIDDRFDRLIKKELDATYKATKDNYNLIDMNYSEARKMGAREYLEMNYKKWLSCKKDEPKKKKGDGRILKKVESCFMHANPQPPVPTTRSSGEPAELIVPPALRASLPPH